MRRAVEQQERSPRPDKHLPLRGGPSDDDFRMSSGGVGYVAAESKHGKERFGDSFATWEKPCRLAQRGEDIPDAYRTKAIQMVDRAPTKTWQPSINEKTGEMAGKVVQKPRHRQCTTPAG